MTIPLKQKWMANLYIAVTHKNATLVEIDFLSSKESGCFELILCYPTPNDNKEISFSRFAYVNKYLFHERQPTDLLMDF